MASLLLIKYGYPWVACLQTTGYSLSNELHLMPLMMIACQMSPKGIEATFYALVLAVINAGYLISYWVGGLLAISLGITGEVGSFGNLPFLVTFATVFPLVALALLLILPKDYETKDLDQSQEEEDPEDTIADISLLRSS